MKIRRKESGLGETESQASENNHELAATRF